MNRDIRLALLGILLAAVAVGGFFYSRGDDDAAGGLEEGSPQKEALEGPRQPAVRRDLIGPNEPATRPAKPVTVEAGTAGIPQPAAANDDFGTPFGAIHGTVRDPSGGPIPGALVKLAVETVPNPAIALPIAGPSLREATTSADGLFFFDGIPTYDVYVIVASHPDFSIAKVYPLKLLPSRTTDVVVNLSAGVTVTGIVQDEGGRALAGAKVVSRYGREAQIDPIRSVERTTLTGPDGRYKLEKIMPGAKCLTAALEGYAQAVHGDVALSARGEQRPVDFILKTGGAIGGKVVGDADQPLQGIRVSAANVLTGNAADADVLAAIVETDDQGRFRIDGLAPGSYVLTAQKEGASQTARTNAAPGKMDVVLKLLSGTVVRGIVVDDETGRPIKAFNLIQSQTEQLNGRPKALMKRVIAADGAFEYTLSYVPPTLRRVYLFALAPGYSGGSVEVPLMPADGPPQPQAKDVKDLVIRVRRGAVVVGRVLDPAGNPVAGARVDLMLLASGADAGESKALGDLLKRSLLNASDGIGGISREDGRFTIAEALPGRYEVRVSHQDFAVEIVEAPVDVGARGESDVGDVRLSKGGRVFGVVLDKNHQPEEGVRVALAPQGGLVGDFKSKLTDVTGEFDFGHVMPGVYTLSIVERQGIALSFANMLAGRGTETKGITVTVAEGEEVRHELR